MRYAEFTILQKCVTILNSLTSGVNNYGFIWLSTFLVFVSENAGVNHFQCFSLILVILH